MRAALRDPKDVAGDIRGTYWPGNDRSLVVTTTMPLLERAIRADRAAVIAEAQRIVLDFEGHRDRWDWKAVLCEALDAILKEKE